MAEPITPANQPTAWLVPDAVFDGTSLRANVALGIAAGRSLSLCELSELPQNAALHRLRGILTPGFLDLQVNGGGDALLNNDPSVATLIRMAEAHRRFGTVGILPTVITDAPEVMARAVDAVIAAGPRPGLLGLHIEGPHISLARRGTHAARWVRPFAAQTLAHIHRLREHGIFVKVTLAPEAASPNDVRAIVATGAVVSIGHSDATAEEVQALLSAGASCFTHLYNAMSQMQGRAPGVVGACINSTAFAGIICDGIHVADEMVALAIRARPVPGRSFVVSDAMSTVGGSDRFTLYGQEVRLRDGRLVNAEGALAGAHVTMAESFARLILRVGISPESALCMAISVPARVLGRPDLTSPERRGLEELLILGDDWRVTGTVAERILSMT